MNPLPFKGEITGGKMITFKCSDGKDGSAFVIRHFPGTICKTSDSSIGGTGYSFEIATMIQPENIVFMFHEWWGLNDYIKQEAVRLSKKLGVSVVAIDLYDGKVAATREDAAQYMQGLKPERASAIIGGAYEGFPPDSRIATIGWCMGGGWAMQAAMNPAPLDSNDARIKGCVIYYGMPETDQTKLSRLHCPILGIFAKKDQWINPKVVSDFEAAMKKAKKKLTVHSYDADHAFANPSNPGFDKKATEDAMKHTEIFLRKVFDLK